MARRCGHGVVLNGDMYGCIVQKRSEPKENMIMELALREAKARLSELVVAAQNGGACRHHKTWSTGCRTRTLPRARWNRLRQAGGGAAAHRNHGRRREVARGTQ